MCKPRHGFRHTTQVCNEQAIENITEFWFKFLDVLITDEIKEIQHMDRDKVAKIYIWNIEKF